MLRAHSPRAPDFVNPISKFIVKFSAGKNTPSRRGVLCHSATRRWLAGELAMGDAELRARVQDFAFGAEPGKLNLRSVLVKARECHASLCRLEQELLFDTENKRWQQLLDLFGMVHRQYQALRANLRTDLGYWAVYPKRVDQEIAMKLQGGMVSPKLLVEQEQENEALTRESDFGDEALLEETIRHVGEVVDRVTRWREGEDGTGALDPRSPLLSGLLAEMRKDRKARAAGGVPTGRGPAGSTSRPEPQLAQMVEFMRTGKL